MTDWLDRRVARWGLALVLAVDLLLIPTRGRLNGLGPGVEGQAAPWLLALSQSPWQYALSVLGLAALWRFARKPARLGSGLAVLACLFALAEVFAAGRGHPYRNFYVSGLTLTGWLLGLGFGRRLGPPVAGSASRRDESIAQLLAMAFFLAIYAGAALNKVLTRGFGWADAASLRGIVMVHHPFAESSWGFFDGLMRDVPAVALALAGLVLLIQGGAWAALLVPRLRALACLGVLAFHQGVQIATDIGYFEAQLVAVALLPPWAQWAARWRGRPERPPPWAPPARTHRAVGELAAALALVLALALALVAAGVQRLVG